LQLELSKIKSFGANLIAISPQLPDQSLSLQEKENLDFHVLSDLGNKVARQFGLVYSLPEELRPVYQQFGIDLPAANGDASFELPVPASYVVDTDGMIILDFVEMDYTKRLEPDIILDALKSISG
jgi:peroxiredoxin